MSAADDLERQVLDDRADDEGDELADREAVERIPITVVAYDASLTAVVAGDRLSYSCGEATGLDAGEAAQHLEHWYDLSPDQSARVINMVNACLAIDGLTTYAPGSLAPERSMHQADS